MNSMSRFKVVLAKWPNCLTSVASSAFFQSNLASFFSIGVKIEKLLYLSFFFQLHALSFSFLTSSYNSALFCTHVVFVNASSKPDLAGKKPSTQHCAECQFTLVVPSVRAVWERQRTRTVCTCCQRAFSLPESSASSSLSSLWWLGFRGRARSASCRAPDLSFTVAHSVKVHQQQQKFCVKLIIIKVK